MSLVALKLCKAWDACEPSHYMVSIAAVLPLLMGLLQCRAIERVIYASLGGGGKRIPMCTHNLMCTRMCTHACARTHTSPCTYTWHTQLRSGFCNCNYNTIVTNF